MVMPNALLTLACPGEIEVAERSHLIEADPPVPVELQRGQEPRHYLISSGAVRDELTERGPAERPQPC